MQELIAVSAYVAGLGWPAKVIIGLVAMLVLWWLLDMVLWVLCLPFRIVGFIAGKFKRG